MRVINYENDKNSKEKRRADSKIYIYSTTDFMAHILDEYKELVIECGYSGTLTYYGEDKAVIRVYRNGVDYKNIYEREI